MLVDDHLAHVVGDRLSDRLGILLDAWRQLVDCPCAELDDQIDQASVFELGYDFAGIGPDVGVE